MTKRYLILLIGAISFLSAGAQDISDALRMSQQNYGFGTARSSAMGGAYSSLGADLASAVMNPAGLGMYRSSEISISPSITTNSATSDNITDIGRFKSDLGRTNFGLNNFGVAFASPGSGSVVSYTFSFGYTRLADFNTNTNVNGTSANSMIDAFVIQMNRSNLVPDNNGVINDFSNAQFWGGSLAYNTWLIDHDQEGYYTPEGLFDLNNPRMDSRFRRATRGSLGQYDFSGGVNISNKLYLGMGLGIQDLSYSQTNSYRETPQNNSRFELNNFNYVQALDQRGSSWNLKFGAIFRPTSDLRLAAAIHTPSYLNVSENFYFDMFSNFNQGIPSQQDGVENDRTIRYNVQTPTRMILGGSYTIKGRAIASIDYERVWYNKIKSFASGWRYEKLDFSDNVSDILIPANNIRAGVEVVLVPGVFGRLGYANYGTMYKDSSLKKYGRSANYSLGLGYRTSEYGIDFTYVFMDSKEAPDQVFNETGRWLDSNDVWQEDHHAESGLYTVNNKRHVFTLTGSLRF